MFLNKSATRCFQKCEVVSAPEGGIKRDKPAQCDLSLEAKKELEIQIPNVRKLLEGNNVSGQDKVADLESSAIRAYVDEFSDALDH